MHGLDSNVVVYRQSPRYPVLEHPELSLFVKPTPSPANDNATVEARRIKRSFWTILALGLDPADLLKDLRCENQADLQLRFRSRLVNFAAALRSRKPAGWSPGRRGSLSAGIADGAGELGPSEDDLRSDLIAFLENEKFTREELAGHSLNLLYATAISRGYQPPRINESRLNAADPVETVIEKRLTPNGPASESQSKDVEAQGDDWTSQLVSQMKGAGILTPPAQFVADGRWHRFAPNPDRKGQSASYRVVVDPVAPTWAFRDWRMGGSLIHGKGKPGRQLTREEQVAWKGRIEQTKRRMEHELAQFHETAANEAETRWNRAAPAPAGHEYLRRKRVKPHGLRIEDGCLLVSLRDATGKLWSLLKIFPDGFKLCQEFARASECFHVLGNLGSCDTICIAEGFATAATIFEATDWPSVSACDAGNLRKVARILRNMFPTVTIYVCGDDDWLTKNGKGQSYNVGKLAAIEAAKAIDGVLALPSFNPSGRPKWATDFNDSFCLFGGRDVDAHGRDDGLAHVRETLRLAREAYDKGRQKDEIDGADFGDEGGDEELPVGAVLKRDFYSFMPQNRYIFTPSRDLWLKGSIQGRFGKNAAEWLDTNRPVEQMTWAPGMPMVIKDKLISEGGWFDRKGVSVFNLYKPPTIKPGNPDGARKWIEHLECIYPDDVDHIIAWLAHRRQRPHEKINHALVLGGEQGIGKDSILEPVKYAVGPWNFQEVSPSAVMGRFNGFLKSVILRISEARDRGGGDFDRYDFYERTKTYIAAPPDVHRVDEKHLREHNVVNVCGVIITTNYKDGLYLPDDDRRHFITWSERDKKEFTAGYWNDFWSWYLNDDGIVDVVAYLDAYDLSGFDPKAPPRRTAAFRAMVNGSRSTEDEEFADTLDRLKKFDPKDNREALPRAVTLDEIRAHAEGDFVNWLNDRKNRRAIPHRLERQGYTAVDNETRPKDGLWKVNGKRQIIYVRKDLSIRERVEAAKKLADPAD
jgi:phage/plasmid primase-like uncharacterized protein